MFLNLYSVRDSQHSKQASWFADRGLGCINSGLQQNRSFLPSTVIAYKCHLISSLLTRTSWINTDKFTMFTNVWNFTSRFIYLFVYYSSNYFYRHSFFFFLLFLSFKLLLIKYILILQVNWPFPGGFLLKYFFLTIICVNLNLSFENVCWYYYRLLSYGTAAVKAEETIHPKERPCSDALTWVSDYAPCFGIHGNSVEILNTPDEFYQTLKVRMITLIQMILFWKQNQVLIINFNLHIILPGSNIILNNLAHITIKMF